MTQATHSEAVEAAVEGLRKDGVVLMPTDTLYALAVSAFSDRAVERIYDIKSRDPKKPLHALVDSVEMAGWYGYISEPARNLLELLPKGKITCVVPRHVECDAGICAEINTFGFRIPDDNLCGEIISRFGFPITATSANRSGERPARFVEKILTQLGDAEEHIDLVLDAGELPEREPSTVVDFSVDPPIILREGAISAQQIKNILM